MLELCVNLRMIWGQFPRHREPTVLYKALTEFLNNGDINGSQSGLYLLVGDARR
jgi:hypothetical protein